MNPAELFGGVFMWVSYLGAVSFQRHNMEGIRNTSRNMKRIKEKQNGKGDSKLKKRSLFVGFWKLAFCILGIISIVGGIIVPWLFQLFLPIFGPQFDITSLNGFMEPASIIISFLSLGLAAYSVWQAHESETQMTEALSGIHSISDHVDEYGLDLKMLIQSTMRANQFGQKSGNKPGSSPFPNPQWDPPAEDERL